MIGNDIIDIKLCISERKSENRRFMAKVFTNEEKGIITNSNDPEITLWLLWSMKEAVYKAHQRNFSLTRTLNPQAFSCTLNAAGNKGTVKIRGYDYHVESEVNSEYIHSHTSVQHTFQKIYRKIKPTKEQILDDLCSSLNLDRSAFRFEKDGNGIPSWVEHNTTKKLPFSLSHHGNFTAFVIPLINS